MNEFLQTIGQLYMELRRLQFILQQREQQAEQSSAEINRLQGELSSLKEELSKSKVTITEFKDIVEKKNGPAQGE